MTDVFTRQKRSHIMSLVKGSNTKPELLVRSVLHRLGFRFRLHRRDLPGCPDIVLPKHHKVIFVHGCFWHGHKGCKRAGRPASNAEFWNAKLTRNIERDRQNISDLRKLGWRSLVVWECETRAPNRMISRLEAFLVESRRHA